MKLLKFVSAVVAVMLTALVSVVLVGASPAQPSVTITVDEPSGPVAFGEQNEYASLVWNDPWDMSQPLDVRQLDSPRCSGVPNHFVDVIPCPGGLWCGRATSDNPDLFLLFPGHASLHHGRDGNLKPINASVYRQLTFRMYVQSVAHGDPGLQVYWTNGTVGDIGGTPAKFGGSHFYKTFPGWHIYTIDLGLETDPENGQLPWTGNITGLRLDPGLNGMTGREVRLDWVRLSPPAAHPIEWTTSESGDIDIGLKKSGAIDPDPLHIYELVGDSVNEVEIQAQAARYDVPASLPPGDWFVHLVVNGLDSGPAGPWQVQPAPALSFVAPSYTSGEDYALAQLGEVWDMNEPSDIFSTGNLAAGPTFSNGSLVATTADTNLDNDCTPYWEDPHINLLDDVYWGQPPDPTDPPIDTNKYRYISFRLFVEGTPDVSFGWVSRFVWADLLSANCGESEDVPLHGGWNVVHLDLWDPNIVEVPSGCMSAWRASGQRRQLRFDPLEVPMPTTFHLDWIKLTAMDTARTGDTFPVKYLRNAVTATVNFFYDTDKNPNNGGGTPMNPVAPPSGQTPGPWAVFLPGVFRRSLADADPAGTQTFWWDLDGVAPGTYYVRGELTNGQHTTTWYSETPVVVTN